MAGQDDRANQARDANDDLVALFVDTSAWFEAFDASSPEHETMARALRENAGSIVTTTYILAELSALMLGRLTHTHATRAGSFIRNSPAVALVHPDRADESAAWRLFVERPDKLYSLTDCLSFVVMRRLKIVTALALDRHFAQEGFNLAPGQFGPWTG